MSYQDQLHRLYQQLSTQIIGQEYLVKRLLIALLADGHLLVEGAPGLAKTKAIKDLSTGIEADFHRIQFTPDLLPSDVTGTEIYRPETGSFCFQQGPVFHNLILADEINRAPAKVQSALLEAMAERQVSVGQKSYALPKLFLVMATQNPLEQEGTYPLPEAQLDRFMMHIKIDYPNAKAERTILQLARQNYQATDSNQNNHDKISQETIFEARDALFAMHMDPSVEEYIVQIVMATRHPDRYSSEIKRWISCGASPRGTIAMDRCARAHALLHDRDYVSPDDVRSICHDVLRHRILLGYEAEAEGVSTDAIINQLLDLVPIG